MAYVAGYLYYITAARQSQALAISMASPILAHAKARAYRLSSH